MCVCVRWLNLVCPFSWSPHKKLNLNKLFNMDFDKFSTFEVTYLITWHPDTRGIFWYFRYLHQIINYESAFVFGLFFWEWTCVFHHLRCLFFFFCCSLLCYCRLIVVIHAPTLLEKPIFNGTRTKLMFDIKQNKETTALVVIFFFISRKIVQGKMLKNY